MHQHKYDLLISSVDRHGITRYDLPMTDEEQRKRLLVRVNSMGRIWDTYKERLLAAHSHNFYVIVLTETPIDGYVVDSSEYDVPAGSLLFLMPGQVHSARELAGIKGMSIIFSSEYFGTIDPMIAKVLRLDVMSRVNVLPLRDDALYARLMDIARQMRTEFDEARIGAASIAMLHALLTQFLLYIYRSAEYRETFAGKKAFSLHFDLYNSFVELVEAHYADNWSVKDYADCLCVSQKTLTTCTHDNTGQTPHAILQERIVLEAKNMLRHTKVSISDIAEELGFSCLSCFVKFFKRAVDVTPSEFRCLADDE